MSSAQCSECQEDEIETSTNVIRLSSTSIVDAVNVMQERADSIREAQQEKEVLQNGCGFKRLDLNEDYYEAG